MANNRQQRRTSKHKGKRPGETYMDVLTQKKLIKEAVERSVHDESVSIEADIKTQRQLWVSVVALNMAFGFGGERARRFMDAMDTVRSDMEKLAKENDWDYAIEKLRQRCEQITGIEVRQVHEEEMLQARKENEANGIYFLAENPEDLARMGFADASEELIRVTDHYGYRKEWLPFYTGKIVFTVYNLAEEAPMLVAAFVDETIVKKECRWLEKMNYGG